MNRSGWVYQWWVQTLALYLVAAGGLEPCTKRMTPARAEQMDSKGLRCWDNVKVPSCGGRCDSREVSEVLEVFDSFTIFDYNLILPKLIINIVYPNLCFVDV